MGSDGIGGAGLLGLADHFVQRTVQEAGRLVNGLERLRFRGHDPLQVSEIGVVAQVFQ
jgi:hypothetical protein